MNALYGLVIAVSFFTIIPMPFVEWNSERTRYMPLFIPVVGLIIGGLSLPLVIFLSHRFSYPLLPAVIMALYYLVISGGVHFDGLMDSADGYFSRRDKARKLEIMTDSRVGAFAVMTAACVLLLKAGCFAELFAGDAPVAAITAVPVFSRLLQPSMLFLFPQAKNDGLARMYGSALPKQYGLWLVAGFVAASAVFVALTSLKYAVVPLVAAAYYVFFYFSSKKQFGGVTGDLLGAFLEVSELIMLMAVVFVDKM